MEPVKDAGAGDNNEDEEAALLAKLEEANRLLEMDEKSCKNLSSYSPTPGHSRKGSGSSVVSSTSSNSHYSNQAYYEEDSTPTRTDISTAESLWDIWGRLVNDWDAAHRKPKYIKELVRRGIPYHFRGLAWQLLLGVHESGVKFIYAEYLKKTSPFEKLIRRDIARTFPDHEFFKEKNGLGQESLFNVMKAYSLHDREVGYCQGSGFIVGLLLMQMPEEEAFAVMVKLMLDYRLREMFKPSMAELGLCMFKLECLMQDMLPTLHLHFLSQNFHTSMYASSWFLTLFATSVSLNAACRIMDVFISEGMEVIFRIGIALLLMYQEDLLALDMEGMIKYFQHEVRLKFDSDVEQIFQSAFQIHYNHKKMKKLEKQYTALKQKENEEQIELRRLRTENTLLRQRIESLEKESASLADRLIHDQVVRATEAEELYAAKNDLAVTRLQLAEKQKKLEAVDLLVADIKERMNCIDSVAKLETSDSQALVCQLQEEMITIRLREAETATLIKELRLKVKELEDTNLQLQRAPSNDVQHLQEELIAVKLREAEAILSLKELRQKVNELESYWEHHLERVFGTAPNTSPKDRNAKQEVRQLQDELMTVRLHEVNAIAETKTCRQKIMELETQNHIISNQIRRMDEENKALKDKLQEKDEKAKELRTQTKDLLRKIDDLESQHKEESMMMRIQEAETAQQIGELKQRIAQLEIQKEELQAAGQLDVKEGTQDLENKIFDLQDEVLQLKLSVSPKNVHGLRPFMFDASLELEDDKDKDDDDSDVIKSTESLNRTLSGIIEGNLPLDIQQAVDQLRDSDGLQKVARVDVSDYPGMGTPGVQSFTNITVICAEDNLSVSDNLSAQDEYSDG